MFGQQLAENGQKVGKTLLGKWEPPAEITATTRVGGGWWQSSQNLFLSEEKLSRWSTSPEEALWHTKTMRKEQALYRIGIQTVVVDSDCGGAGVSEGSWLTFDRDVVLVVPVRWFETRPRRPKVVEVLW